MHSTLIDVDVLAAHVDAPDWCIVDCRADLADHTAGARAYGAGHIPNAHFADLETELSGPVVPGVSGRHPLPDRSALRTTLGRWGVTAETQMVVYDADNGMFAARAWWLARWLGHEAVAVLDGGLAAWREAGQPLSEELPGTGTAAWRELVRGTRVRTGSATPAFVSTRWSLGDTRPERRGCICCVGRAETP